VYLISFFGAVFASFQAPAYSASIVMLVRKDQLTRANSMVQLGEAIESILTPLLAGALFGLIGMRGIIIIDVVTYFIAISTLIFVHIPQPKRQDEEAKKQTSVFKDISIGWQFLSANRGLLGLLMYFAGVNFFANISAVMVGPLVLSFSTATSMGFAQMMMGLGMFLGSLLMSIWGGPKGDRIKLIIGAISLSSSAAAFSHYPPADSQGRTNRPKGSLNTFLCHIGWCGFKLMCPSCAFLPEECKNLRLVDQHHIRF